jgi:hypothetical protein
MGKAASLMEAAFSLLFRRLALPVPKFPRLVIVCQAPFRQCSTPAPVPKAVARLLQSRPGDRRDPAGSPIETESLGQVLSVDKAN